MALAPITWTDTNQSEYHVGHFTLDYDAHTQWRLTSSNAGGGTLYTISDKIDTTGFDSLTFTVITSSDGGSGAAFVTIAPLTYNELATGTDGAHLNSITATAAHQISLIDDGDLDTQDIPQDDAGSGNNAYLTLEGGWLDLKVVGKHVVIAGITGSAGTTCKVEIQLHKRRN
jgi:hypothetical protein